MKPHRESWKTLINLPTQQLQTNPLRMPNNQQANIIKPTAGTPEKMGLHYRSKHKVNYDFNQLTQACPDLAQHTLLNQFGTQTIDFSNPVAVKLLNRAILKYFYGIQAWDIPENYLCPPIPGRADYIHHAADLLGSTNNGFIPQGASVHILDIGVGANCVYPIIGHSEYGWSFLGVDTDPVAISSAIKIIRANNSLTNTVQLNTQITAANIFIGILGGDRKFDLSICNPPFHSSIAAAHEGTERKWKGLGKRPATKLPLLNFGGQAGELWCPGGEAEFIGRMIKESAMFPHHCLWYSTLVSKESNLAKIHLALKKTHVADSRTIEMKQGQKKSRIVAWTFLNAMQRQNWCNSRFNQTQESPLPVSKN